MLEPGDHGSTFAGGPLAAAAALAVLDVVDDPALLRRVRELGARLARGACSRSTASARSAAAGLMLGVGLEEGIDAAALGADLLRARPGRQRPRARDPAPAAAADGRRGELDRRREFEATSRSARCTDRYSPSH